MRLQRAVCLVLGVVAAIVWVGSPVPQAQRPNRVLGAVAARVAAGERVQVIVGVDARFVPEGDLPGAAAVADQRSGIARAVAGVREQAMRAGISVGESYEFIPYFPATVDRGSLAALASMPGVSTIEEVVLASPFLYQSVPIVSAPPAWQAGFDGSNWTVAILDTGADYDHPAFGGGVWSEACYSSGGVSLCPNGQSEMLGQGSAYTSCAAGLTGCDHGTHVTAIAAGIDTGFAGAGVARGAGIVAMNVFSYDPASGGIGSSPVDQLKAMSRVFALAGPGNANRIAAINMSLGSGRFTSYCDGVNPSMKAAIDNLRSIGIATVIASGNDGFTGAMATPACISSAISVGNVRKDLAVYQGNPNGGSNEAPFLSLLAPGTDIRAAVMFHNYDVKTGTSMAAPHVAGAWAVLKQAVPTASVASVLAALRATGRPIADPRTGRVFPLIDVNAARIALQSGAFSTPGAPASFTAAASGNTISLSWAAPAPGAGGTPTGYTVVVRGGPGGPIQTQVPVGAVTALSAPVPNGVYHLSVVATNAVGTGPESTGVTVTVPALAPPPGPPSSLAASVLGTTVTFSWGAPSGGGPVSGYVLQAGLTPGFTTPLATLPLPGGATTVAAPNVPAGRYYARVVSQGPGGSSAASNEVTFVVTGAAAPGTPTLHAPVVTGATVTLSWSPSASGGAPASYLLTAATTPGGAPIAAIPLGGTGVTLGGVPSGTYHLRLSAVNTAGTSAPSAPVVLVVP